MMDLAAFIGYRLRRIRGALAAAAGFLLPSLALVLVMSWTFFTYGARPEVRDLVIALDGLVVGVLASVTLDFGTEHARGVLPAVLAVGAFVAGVSGANVLWATLGAFAVGAVALRGNVRESEPARTVGYQRFAWRRLALAAVPGLVVVAGVTAAAVALVRLPL